MNIKYNLKGDKRSSEFIPKEKLSFGKLRTDHMFLMDYDGEWKNPRIIPYGNLSIAPGAIVLQYGQEIFEGAKAFKHDNGSLYTFRLDENAKRFNHSARILCMPQLQEEYFIQAVHKLIKVEKLWMPTQNDSSLYIRPFMIGTEDSLGVSKSSAYTFGVFLSPSGPYYKDGFTKPIKLLITDTFHRAVSGGTGSAKAGGNYAASLQAGEYAKKNGAMQVLYLDTNNEYIEEAGAMNHFHVKNGEIIIPDFTDTILKSITSMSILDLEEELGVKVKQEKTKVKDFIADIKSGKITEAGGLGTAATVTSVGSYIFNNEEIIVSEEIGPITMEIYKTLTGIQKGLLKDTHGWLEKVC